MEVVVLNRQRGHRLERGDLVAFLEGVGDELGPVEADSVAVSLVSDRRIRQYNRDFRGQDRPTDVLSFPTGADMEAPPGERHLGDIVISVDAAARQAREARHALDRELKILSLHGFLHLLGYDHEVDDGEMMRLQRRLIRRFLAEREAVP